MQCPYCRCQLPDGIAKCVCCGGVLAPVATEAGESATPDTSMLVFYRVPVLTPHGHKAFRNMFALGPGDACARVRQRLEVGWTIDETQEAQPATLSWADLGIGSRQRDLGTEWALRKIELLKHFTVIEATVLGLSIGLSAASGSPTETLFKLGLSALLISVLIGCMLLSVIMNLWHELDEYNQWLNAKVDVMLADVSAIGMLRAQEQAKGLKRASKLFNWRILGSMKKSEPAALAEIAGLVRDLGIPERLLKPHNPVWGYFCTGDALRWAEPSFVATGLGAFVLMLLSVVLR